MSDVTTLLRPIDSKDPLIGGFRVSFTHNHRHVGAPFNLDLNAADRQAGHKGRHQTDLCAEGINDDNCDGFFCGSGEWPDSRP